ncbi:glycosyltransferase family 4 protein [Tetragenococcus halophilus]|uniref:Glycosyltransferase family 4 protein n=1 Tax=Tetragenococcus halophilus TaxID=51669 RepID=A0AB35HQD4_TETHA|nr:glycosyltransferase family 4 protein [Tetragenococcus halophilus]MCO8298523.1 glycosyltransferase family 4 protein [Tetragenococcus halophilus]
MKKDVLFMCQFFYPEYVSSAMLPYQTALGLKKAGFSVDAMCGYPKEYLKNQNQVPQEESIEGINIYRKKYLQLGRKNFISRLINYFSFTFVMLLNLFKCRHYKVIIVYSNPPILPLIAVLAKKLFGCKIVFVAYDLYPEIAERTGVLKPSSLISEVMKRVNKLLYMNVSKIIALSNEMKQFMIDNRPVDKNKIAVIPNWATEKNTRAKIKNKTFRDIKENTKLIVSYFGNMGTAQDLDTIIKMISDERIKHSEIFFIFAGHGNKKEELKKRVEYNNLANCQVYDYLSGDDFNDALNISDIFLVSLASNLSGLAVPSKTYSYYQSQKPVISIMDKNTDISKELKKYEAGYAVENEDSEELINFLLEIKDKPKKIYSMEANVTTMYNQFYRKEIQIKKYISIINEVLGA